MDLDQIVPILQRNDWRGAGAVPVEPLLDRDTPNSILVSYGICGELSNAYLTTEHLEGIEMDLDAVAERAIENLRQLPDAAAWMTFDDEPGMHLLAQRAGELTSSRILLPEVMQEAQKRLDCELVHVVVPDRFTILASTDPLSIIGMAKGFFDDAVRDNTAPLSSRVYVFADGQPVGYAKHEDEEPEPDPGDKFSVDKHLVGAPFLMLALVANVDGELDDATMNAFRTYIDQHMGNLSRGLQTMIGHAFNDPQHWFQQAAEAPPMVSMLTLITSMNESLPAPVGREYSAFLIGLVEAMAATTTDDASEVVDLVNSSFAILA